MSESLDKFIVTFLGESVCLVIHGSPAWGTLVTMDQYLDRMGFERNEGVAIDDNCAYLLDVKMLVGRYQVRFDQLAVDKHAVGAFTVGTPDV